jgi:HlyD family secretion protein
MNVLLSRIWSYRWYVLAGVMTLGVAVAQGPRLVLGPIVVVGSPQHGDLVQTIVASGHVETPFRVEIGSQITGIVEDVLVAEGDIVSQGQTLVILDGRELRALVEQAAGVVSQSEARIRQIEELTLPAARESLAMAEATLLSSQQTYDRSDQLVRSGYATRVALEDARKNLDVARTQVRTAKLQVYTAGPDGSDYILAKTQLGQARAAEEYATSRLGYATISAPRTGLLITRSVERGTIVQAGRALMVLAPAGAMELVLQIDERNIGSIAVGQPAIASADAFPAERFSAQIIYINPSVEIARASIEVKLGVPDPPPYLRQDMTVSVDIEVARRTATMIVPIQWIQDLSTPAPWVRSARDGRVVRQPVLLGVRGNTKVEILDGLLIDHLVVPNSSGVDVGQRLRPVLR